MVVDGEALFEYDITNMSKTLQRLVDAFCQLFGVHFLYRIEVSQFAPENIPPQKERIFFRASFFRGELLNVSGECHVVCWFPSLRLKEL